MVIFHTSKKEAEALFRRWCVNNNKRFIHRGEEAVVLSVEAKRANDARYKYGCSLDYVKAQEDYINQLC